MTIKEVSSVIDDINEWENPRGGSVFYVTAIFTDESVGSVGRKDHDAALEVQGLLRESIGVEQDFVLEPKGATKTGREKFKILGFGTPGGAATYTAPGSVQGGGNSQPAGEGRTQVSAARSRSPEHDHYIQERMDRRTALMQGVASHATTFDEVLDYANAFYAWLRLTSEPASSAYEGGGTDTALPAGSPLEQAGVGSEDREEGAGAGNNGDSVAPVLGEGTPAPSSHIHDWQPHPQLRGKLKCECGEMRNKASME